MNSTLPEAKADGTLPPNFLIIGAAKAGTTSLYHYLNQHPDIFMSPLKEPKFFALEGEEINFKGPSQIINSSSVNTLEDYCHLFDGVKDESAIGEASPLYLYSHQAPHRIHHYLPKVKLIAILRNPADRAFSSYSHLLREGFETLDFEQALTAESSRIKEKWAPLWYYQNKGFYFQQLKRYFDLFASEQIRIYLFEDLCQSPITVVQDIYRFLAVDPSFEPDLTKRNVSGIPNNVLLQRLLTRDNPVKTIVKSLLPKRFRKKLSLSIQNKNLSKKVTLNPHTRQSLKALYQDDIKQLETLIKRDLSAWLI